MQLGRGDHHGVASQAEATLNCPHLMFSRLLYAQTSDLQPLGDIPCSTLSGSEASTVGHDIPSSGITTSDMSILVLMEPRGQSREQVRRLKNNSSWGARRDNSFLSEIHVISPSLSGVESYREWQEKEFRQHLESEFDCSLDIN